MCADRPHLAALAAGQASLGGSIDHTAFTAAGPDGRRGAQRSHRPQVPDRAPVREELLLDPAVAGLSGHVAGIASARRTRHQLRRRNLRSASCSAPASRQWIPACTDRDQLGFALIQRPDQLRRRTTHPQQVDCATRLWPASADSARRQQRRPMPCQEGHSRHGRVGSGWFDERDARCV